MGSTLSRQSGNVALEDTEPKTKKSNLKDDRRSSLTGMDKVNYVCRRKKRAYDECNDKYYKAGFLTATSMENPCDDLYDRYKKCFLKGLRKEVWDKQGLPPPRDGSDLAEACSNDE